MGDEEQPRVRALLELCVIRIINAPHPIKKHLKGRAAAGDGGAHNMLLSIIKADKVDN